MNGFLILYLITFLLLEFVVMMVVYDSFIPFNKKSMVSVVASTTIICALWIFTLITIAVIVIIKKSKGEDLQLS